MLIRFLVSILSACVLTILVELPVQVIGFGKIQKKYKVLIYVLTNVITNLSLNLLITLLYFVPLFQMELYYYILVCVLELTVVVAEALIYQSSLSAPAPRAFIVSLVANALSFTVGLLLGI